MVLNDLLLARDAGASCILILCDLSAAFDTLDHSILFNCLENCVGIRNTALSWFYSYFNHRSFSIKMGGFRSSRVPLSCGVPQGTILGPLLFSIYMLSLGHIIRKHKVSFFCYADDTQLYVLLRDNDFSGIKACLADIKCWMWQNVSKKMYYMFYAFYCETPCNLVYTSAIRINILLLLFIKKPVD